MDGTTLTSSHQSPPWRETATVPSRPCPPAPCRCPQSSSQVRPWYRAAQSITFETSWHNWCVLYRNHKGCLNKIFDWIYLKCCTFSLFIPIFDPKFKVNISCFVYLPPGGSATSSPAMLGIRRHSSNYQRAQSSMQLDTYYGDSLHKRQYTGLYYGVPQGCIQEPLMF